MDGSVTLYRPPADVPAQTFLPGDLLFFYGTGWQSRVIEFATRGPSHVGIITDWYYPHCETGPLLAESTTLCDLPDAVSGAKIAGVQLHRSEDRIEHYDGRIVSMRLAQGWELEQHEVYELRNSIEPLHGKPYNLGGAIASGTRLFKWTPLLPYPNLGHLFCSELVAEMLMRLGRMPLWDPAVYNPASLMRTLLRCASYDAPLEVPRA